MRMETRCPVTVPVTVGKSQEEPAGHETGVNPYVPTMPGAGFEPARDCSRGILSHRQTLAKLSSLSQNLTNIGVFTPLPFPGFAKHEQRLIVPVVVYVQRVFRVAGIVPVVRGIGSIVQNG